MSFRVIFHAQARLEATDAARDIARHASVDVALRWYEGLDGCIASLSEKPRRFGYAREHLMVPEWELRQVIFKSHRIILRIEGKRVDVLHVRHVAQDSLEASDLDSPETNRPA